MLEEKMNVFLRETYKEVVDKTFRPEKMINTK